MHENNARDRRSEARISIELRWDNSRDKRQETIFRNHRWNYVACSTSLRIYADP